MPPLTPQPLYPRTPPGTPLASTTPSSLHLSHPTTRPRPSRKAHPARLSNTTTHPHPLTPSPSAHPALRREAQIGEAGNRGRSASVQYWSHGGPQVRSCRKRPKQQGLSICNGVQLGPTSPIVPQGTLAARTIHMAPNIERMLMNSDKSVRTCERDRGGSGLRDSLGGLGGGDQKAFCGVWLGGGGSRGEGGGGSVAGHVPVARRLPPCWSLGRQPRGRDTGRQQFCLCGALHRAVSRTVCSSLSIATPPWTLLEDLRPSCRGAPPIWPVCTTVTCSAEVR